MSLSTAQLRYPVREAVGLAVDPDSAVLLPGAGSGSESSLRSSTRSWVSAGIAVEGISITL